MSDGPHRSLKMNNCWRKAAERAEESDFDTEIIAANVVRGVIEDSNDEVPSKVLASLRDLYNDGQQEMFPNAREQKFQDMHRRAAGHPLAIQIIRGAQFALADGITPREAVLAGIEDALSDRASARIRQIEEHYERHPRSSARETAQVRHALEVGSSQAPFDAAVHHILGLAKIPSLHVDKQTGLDDGPRL